MLLGGLWESFLPGIPGPVHRSCHTSLLYKIILLFLFISFEPPFYKEALCRFNDWQFAASFLFPRLSPPPPAPRAIVMRLALQCCAVIFLYFLRVNTVLAVRLCSHVWCLSFAFFLFLFLELCIATSYILKQRFSNLFSPQLYWRFQKNSITFLPNY